MKNGKLALTLFCFAFLNDGCASHQFMRGNVAMKINKKTAHVCLGENEVRVGDRVNFYTHDCNQPDSSISGLMSLCSRQHLGVGTVSKVANSHYSTVSTDGSFLFEEGTLVEKESQ